MKPMVEQNDIVVLIDENLRKIIVDTNGKTDKIRGIGVIDPKTLVGKEYGDKLQIGSKQFWLLVPSVQDKLQGLHRQAQIILPRDAAHILMNCSIEPGQKRTRGRDRVRVSNDRPCFRGRSKWHWLFPMISGKSSLSMR